MWWLLQVVLFTLDESILSRIEEWDRREGPASHLLLVPSFATDEPTARASPATDMMTRPNTGGKGEPR